MSGDPNAPDRTAELNQMIVEAKGGLTLEADAWYRCDASVELFDKPGFIFDMTGATIWRAVHRPGRVAVMSVHVRGGAVALRYGLILGHKQPTAGYNAQVEGHHGIGAFAAAALELDHVHIEHVPGDFLYLMSTGKKQGPGAPLTPCGSVVLNGVDCYDAGRHAVAALAVRRLEFGADNRFRRFTHKPVDLEQGGGYRTKPTAIVGQDQAVWQKHAA